MSSNSHKSGTFNAFLVHVLAWIGAIAVRMLIHYIYYERLQQEVILQILVSQVFLIGLAYWHLLVLVPRFLQRKRWWIYGFGLVISLAAFTLAKDGAKYVAGLSYHGYYHEVLQFVVLGMVYGAILMAVRFFQDERRNQELVVQLKEAESEKLQAELATLKAQIHPHFLFNTLNNIYALSMAKSDKTPEYILMLSELMSHIIYESNARYVPLEQELKFIQHYIDLEKIRLDDSHRIRIEIGPGISDQQIAPLLLIPLVENAFKHGAKEKDLDFLMQANLKSGPEGSIFEFCCENSMEDQPSGQNAGIGIANLQQRLERLYPGRYSLVIDQQEKRYRVTLIIPIEKPQVA